MAGVRRGAAYHNIFRNSLNILTSHRKPVLHKLSRWTSFVYKNAAYLSVAGGLCAVPFTQKTEILSHESLVRRAASLVTDSSSTFLSQTTLAVIEAFTDYAKAVHTLIALHKQYLSSLGKLTTAQEDSVWQLIVSQRAEVDDRSNECKRFESSWFSAIKLCETAAEAAFIAGAEQASVAVMTNVQLAQSQVKEAQKLSEDADKKLREAKVMEVERMVQSASSTGCNEEEDVPEAYLRED